MPGLTIVAGDIGTEADILAALSGLARDIEQVELLFHVRGRIAVLWAAHESHPKRIIHTALGDAILEGILPGLDDSVIDAELRDLICALHEDASVGQAAAMRWASRTDGDFVLVIVSYANARVVIVNDALGRLPLYACESPTSVVISREIKTAVALRGPGTVDRGTIAQILLFGFPLGGRTLIREINVLAPASAVALGFSPLSYRKFQYRTWNFEELVNASGSQNQSITSLVDLFESACVAQARIPGFSGSMLTLSGGLDSRAVAAALAKNTAFVASTFRTSEGTFDRDAALAREVARSLNIPWRLYSLKQPTWRSFVDTALLRDGLNYGGMASRLEYLASVRRDYGNRIMCFTGDGGDKVLPDLRGPWWMRTLDQFLQYRLNDSIWPLADVSSMLALDQRCILDEISAHFDTYAERDMRNREVHFLLTERAWGWLLEGEERNRTFSWHQTPFYSHRFFEYAMGFHPDQKRSYKLYASFFHALNRQLASIPNAKWNAPLGSVEAERYELKQSLRSNIPLSLRRAVRPLLRRLRKHAEITNSVPAEIAEGTSQLLCDESIQEVFPSHNIGHLLHNCNDDQFYYLATILIYVAHTWSCLQTEVSS